MKTNLKFITALAFVLCIGLFLTSCSNDDDGDFSKNKTIIVPDALNISDANFFPEDLIIAKKTLFASGFSDGTIKSFDLTTENPTPVEFAALDGNFNSRWGFATDGNVLVNNANNIDFATFSPVDSKLIEYNLSTGAKTGEWPLPDGTMAQAVQIAEGKYYVGNFTSPVIYEVDPVANTVNNAWFTSTEWDPANGGLGGIIYNGNGFYTSQGGKLWYLPISNGTPGTLQEVTVSGIDNVDIDGITWDGNNTIYYATNDAGEGTDNGGILYKVVLSDAVTATGSIVQSGFFNSSGVWYLANGGAEYVFVAESQLGTFFGATGQSPINIDIVQL